MKIKMRTSKRGGDYEWRFIKKGDLMYIQVEAPISRDIL